jgi:hypothetical protein
MSIHFGRNIVIDGARLGADEQRFETEVQQQLTQLLTFQTGAAVIGEIWGRRGHTLRIVPWQSNEHNADATPTSDQGAFARGAPIRSGADGHLIRGARPGTGRGSDSRVRYTPFIFASDMGGWTPRTRQAWADLTGQPPPAPGDDRGEFLLHEIIHSLQHLTGTLTNDPMRTTPFDTVSEFNAIVVTNIYSSERGRTLRSHHHGFTPAHDPSQLRTNPLFVTRINELRKRLPGLVARLSRIQTGFNPFRAATARL